VVEIRRPDDLFQRCLGRLYDNNRSRRKARDVKEIIYAVYDTLKFLLEFLVEVVLVFHIVGAIDFLGVGISTIPAAINSPVATIRITLKLNAAEGAFHRILLNDLLV